MQGASSDSLHALTEALASAVEGGADASRIGEDLFGVFLKDYKPSAW